MSGNALFLVSSSPLADTVVMKMGENGRTMRRFLKIGLMLGALVPATALACKLADPEATFEAAREQARLLWLCHLGVSGVILVFDLRARRASRAGILAAATSLHPWWLVPSTILPLGCLELKPLTAQICLAVVGGLLARRILMTIRKQG